jgi:hypothetical protein
MSIVKSNFQTNDFRADKQDGHFVFPPLPEATFPDLLTVQGRMAMQ